MRQPSWRIGDVRHGSGFELARERSESLLELVPRRAETGEHRVA
jgi:hypothetical protein